MDPKTFLKPTRGKIILAIIILILFPLPMWNGLLLERCTGESCPTTRVFGPAILLWYIFWGDNAFSCHHADSEFLCQQAQKVAFGALYNIIPSLLVFGLPISYLVSCTIIWAYDRRKRK